MSLETPDTLGLPWKRGAYGPLAALEVGEASEGRVVVYLHGGGYTGNSSDETAPNAALLARHLGARVISLDYPLAPGSAYPETTRLVVEAHRAIMATVGDARGIAYVGDSAGGGLAAGSALRMRDEGVPMPGALVLMSPWTDLTDAGDSRISLVTHDPGLRWAGLDACAVAYAGIGDRSHPYASPVYGSFEASAGGSSFPPALIQAGTAEILLSDAVRLYQRMLRTGGKAELDVYDGMAHIWMFAEPGSADAVQAFSRAARFVRDRLGWDVPS